MGTQVRWQNYPSPTTYLTTELNSLADGANILGGVIANHEDGYMYMDVELRLATQGAARSAGAYVALYILPSVDGSNYCYGDVSVDPPASALAGTFPLDAVDASRICVLTHILVPAGKFKMLVMNETGQAFAVASNWVKYVLYAEELG